MGIREFEDALFEKWKASRKDLVKDGVADEDAYLKSFPKLLFLLKEVNAPGPGGGGWDLREFLSKGGHHSTCNNITRWVEGIRRLPDDIPWSKLQTVDEDRRCRTLRSIAAMNLKKSHGGPITDATPLTRIATEDKDFLNQQFLLYDSDIVICCGTDVTNTFHKRVLGVSPEWKTTRRGIKYHEYKPKKYIVDFFHPAIRVDGRLLYYGLVDALREILHPQLNMAVERDAP